MKLEDVEGSGWALFESDRGLELCRDDADGRFASDDEAWRYVWNEAREGNLACKQALDELKEKNPFEWANIRNWNLYDRPARYDTEQAFPAPYWERYVVRFLDDLITERNPNTANIIAGVLREGGVEATVEGPFE